MTYEDLKFTVLEDGPFKITKITSYGGYRYDPTYEYHFVCNQGMERIWGVSGGIMATLDLGVLGVQRVQAQVGDLITLNGAKWAGELKSEMYRKVKGTIEVGKANMAKVRKEAEKDALERKQRKLERARLDAHEEAVDCMNATRDRIGERLMISRWAIEFADRMKIANELTHEPVARFATPAEFHAFKKARDFVKSAYQANELMIALLGTEREKRSVFNKIDFGVHHGIPEGVVTAALHGLREALQKF